MSPSPVLIKVSAAGWTE